MSAQSTSRRQILSQICTLWRDGHTPTEIAQITGDRVEVVRSVVKREQDAGNLTRQRAVQFYVPDHIRKRLSSRARHTGQTVDAYVRTILLEALDNG